MRKLIIHPFGETAGIPPVDLARGLSDSFGIEAVPGPSQPIPDGAYDHRRGQYRSSAFLEALTHLKRMLPPEDRSATSLLGLTAVDLFVPRLNFVFGEADWLNGVAVISLHRLRPGFYGEAPDQHLFAERALKEAVHELGHVFGLPHCPNPRCVMHFSNAIGDTDLKGPGFDPECKKKLAALGIGPVL